MNKNAAFCPKQAHARWSVKKASVTRRRWAVFPPSAEVKKRLDMCGEWCHKWLGYSETRVEDSNRDIEGC